MIEIKEVIGHSVMVTIFVFVMMLVTDYINVLTKGKLSTIIRGGRWRQYTVSSFLGATPGCLGAFMNVSFYARGLLSFGAIVGGMIATSGDEAYVMLALFPKTALLLFGILFILGIIIAATSDKIAQVFKIKPCGECRLALLHSDDKECRCFDINVWKSFPRIMLVRVILLILLIILILSIITGFIGSGEHNWEEITLIVLLVVTIFIILTVSDHYLKEHIWTHIIKEHIWRVFLWTFFALLFVEIGLKYWNLENFVGSHLTWVLLLSGLVGIIPESGPHFVFVAMFSKGLIPFSVLLTSSMVQDGHGMLPLLSYSIRDSLLIKLFNLFFGLGIGIILYCIGL